MRSIIFIILFIPFTLIMGTASIISMLIIRNKNIGYYYAHIWSKASIFLAGIKVKVKGIENLKTNKPVIYIANHQSLFDIPLLYAYIKKPFIIMAKKSLFQIPIFGWHLSLSGNIPINRQDIYRAAESLLKALKKAKGDYSILLFPEGTRSLDGNLLPFKRGAFLLAKRVCHPIIPVIIKGTNQVLPKGKLLIKSSIVELEFMNMITNEEINKFSIDELTSNVWNLMHERTINTKNRK